MQHHRLKLETNLICLFFCCFLSPVAAALHAFVFWFWGEDNSKSLCNLQSETLLRGSVWKHCSNHGLWSRRSFTSRMRLWCRWFWAELAWSSFGLRLAWFALVSNLKYLLDFESSLLVICEGWEFMNRPHASGFARLWLLRSSSVSCASFFFSVFLLSPSFLSCPVRPLF